MENKLTPEQELAVGALNALRELKRYVCDFTRLKREQSLKSQNKMTYEEAWQHRGVVLKKADAMIMTLQEAEFIRNLPDERNH